MANYLKMAEIESIKGLLKPGWSFRRIARELNIHRETVGRHAKQGAVAGFEVTAGGNELHGYALRATSRAIEIIYLIN